MQPEAYRGVKISSKARAEKNRMGVTFQAILTVLWVKGEANWVTGCSDGTLKGLLARSAAQWLDQSGHFRHHYIAVRWETKSRESGHLDDLLHLHK